MVFVNAVISGYWKMRCCIAVIVGMLFVRSVLSIVSGMTMLFIVWNAVSVGTVFTNRRIYENRDDS